MGRRPRLDMTGFHHVVNRGIERSNVYSDSAVSKVIVAMSRKSGDS